METEKECMGNTKSVDNGNASVKEWPVESGYVGRFIDGGRIIAAGKFVGGALSLYGRDGKFHYNPRYEKMYYEGEFDDISDEEFEKFKKAMDALGLE